MKGVSQTPPPPSQAKLNVLLQSGVVFTSLDFALSFPTRDARLQSHVPRLYALAMAHVILTAIGGDRPGLVEEVSEYAFSRGANIEDSRMVNLRGQFAIMVLLGGPDQTVSRLREDLGLLSRQTALHAELHDAKPTTSSETSGAQALPYRLTGTALDQSGLVHRISHLLRELHVNIESLETRLRPAPYTGAPMFDMELILLVPRTTSLSQLRQNLTRHCDELNVD